MQGVGALCADYKWQIANGKWQISELRWQLYRCQMPEASQGAINLLTEQILKGGVPLFEERGTAFGFVVFKKK